MNGGLSIPLRIEGGRLRNRERGERGITILRAGLKLIPRVRTHPIFFC
jgi:hypothetical protein